MPKLEMDATFIAKFVGTMLLFFLAAACSDPSPLTPLPVPVQPSSPPEISNSRLASAVVVNVIDTVTIEVKLDGRRSRIRYLGLETPTGANDTLLNNGLMFNQFLVQDKIVELEQDHVDKDRSGNLIRYVYVSGEFVNEALLTNGYAVVAGFPHDFRSKTDFTIAQEKAKSQQLGYWEPRLQEKTTTGITPSVEPFTGGTLPSLPGNASTCEFSGTPQSVIKGNVDARTGDRIYYVPGSLFYSTTEVTRSEGDRWFCTEAQAVASGWKKSKR